MFGQHPYEKPNAVGCADRVNWIQSGCNNISKFKNIRIARRDHFWISSPTSLIIPEPVCSVANIDKAIRALRYDKPWKAFCSKMYWFSSTSTKSMFLSQVYPKSLIWLRGVPLSYEQYIHRVTKRSTWFNKSKQTRWSLKIKKKTSEGSTSRNLV